MNCISLKYEGFFNDSITGQLTALLDCALIENRLDSKARLRLKALLVEQIQNIQRYSSNTRQGSLEIGQEDDTLYVETVNPVGPEDRQRINDRLYALAGADGQTLQKRYRAAIREPFGESDHSAGMGFLMLARQSSRQLDYRFVPGNDQDVSFRLKSYL